MGIPFSLRWVIYIISDLFVVVIQSLSCVQLFGTDPDSGKDRKQEEMGMTEYEMVGWCHQLNGHEFEQALGVGDGQGSLVCCSPWGHKESDTTELLN